MSNLPLVSVIIPAYKPQFFEAALISAVQQSYPALEVVVCDDSLGPWIEEAVKRQQARTTVPIQYQRNTPPLGELYNAVRTIEVASGKYIKFLHDDDELAPECVARMVAAIESNPQVALVACRRTRIDDVGTPLPDILQTTFPFDQDALLDGKELVSFLADHTLNFIGEPSCLLCRRTDVLAFGRELMSINGCLIHWVGDLAMAAKVLQGGDLAFLAEPLARFRVTQLQGSQDGRQSVGIGDQGHANFRRTVREMGWHTPTPLPRTVTVAPLPQPQAGKPVDLLGELQGRFNRARLAEVMQAWIAHRTPSPIQQRLITQHLAEAGPAPLIEIIVLDPSGDRTRLKRTLTSIDRLKTRYPAIQALVLNDIHFINPMIEQSDAAWVMLAQAGDEFTEGGLTVTGLELLGGPDIRAVYGDALLRKPDGSLSTGMRPDFNLDYLLSFPLAMERHWLFRRDVLLAAGGFDPAFAQALEFELVLRLITQGGMVGFGHVHEPWVIAEAPVLRDNPAQRAAIEEHLRLRGYEKPLVKSAVPGQYQIDYGHAWQPLVSVVVSLHDDVASVQRCVMSLFEHTTYARYELLIVDNGSRLPASRSWLQAMEKMAPGRIRVVSAAERLAHSAAMNLGAAQAQGEYLLFVRAAVAFVQPQWLDEMLNHALRQEVAIVGAKAVTGEGRVTHAGLILGLNGVAATAFDGEPLDAAGYLGRLQVEQNYSAVSDLCLMVRKSVFDEVGGFDALTFTEQGADVDLCLRIAALGYLTVWTPRAVLLYGEQPLHYSASAQRAMFERWLPLLARDPAYNLNFALHERSSFDLVDARINWRPLGWRPLPVVMAIPADPYGAGHYRIIQPFNALKAAGKVEGMLCGALMQPADLARYTPDSIILQRPVSEGQLPLLQDMKAWSRAFKVFELDDYLPNLPLKSVHRGNFGKDVLRTIRRGLDCVDRFVVSTEPLAQAFKGMHPDIRVVPNRLDPLAWGDLPVSRRRAGARPRVGWVGGTGHDGDLALIFDLVKALAGEVDWVFLGGVPAAMRPYAASFHPGVDLSLYPQMMASLDLDLALAPLEQNLFNECKSNLRVLEYGICGYPVICSDIAPYRGGLPVTLVRNRYKDWLDAIRAHLADLDATARRGDELREVVRRDWMLDERGLAQWREAWLG